jgi:hypothetical protein
VSTCEPRAFCCGNHCCPDGTTCCGNGCCDPNLCQTCVDGHCQSRCDSSLCEDCNNGFCEVCGGDTNKICCDGTCCDSATECCVNGECKPKCIPEGGELCQYTLPGGVPCAFNNIDDPTCVPCWGPGCEGMMCEWAPQNPPKNNDICQPGCGCELHNKECVMAYTKTCQNTFCWYVPPPWVCCTCEEPGGLVTLEPFGSRTVCGPGP